MTNGLRLGLAILLMLSACAISVLTVARGTGATSVVFQQLFLLACAVSGLFLPHRALVGGLVLLTLTLLATLVGVVWYEALWAPLNPPQRFDILIGISVVSGALLLFSMGRNIAHWRNRTPINQA